VASDTITDNDRQLFRDAVADVRPLYTDKHHLKPAKTTAAKQRRSPPIDDPPLHYESLQMDEVGMNHAVAYISPGLQKKVLRKLRHGFFDIDAELDLHGLNAQEARHRLFEFLARSVQVDLRCVHIIHGKGYRSPDNRPVLKNKLNLWLRQHDDVLAFCSSSPDDGGTGAVYVLLRPR
jgi:DNA-nicking Smr family endonuclease